MNLIDFPAKFQCNVRVDEVTGCWSWQATMVDQTPVYTPMRGKGCSARRYAWERVNGRTKLPFVTYTCDDATCVRPEHAEPITGKRMVKVRRARGEQMHGASWRAKVAVAKRKNSKVGSIERAREIRARVARGETMDAIAADYAIHRATVWSIWHDEIWKEAPASALSMLVQQQMRQAA